MPTDAREERSLLTIGLLTRGALHEISNPLVGLVGSAELALADAEPGTKLHDRIALTRSTGAEIARIVRALQAFIRLQELPAGPLSLGDAAVEAVALVDLVLPTHDVTLTASGDATVVTTPGELSCSLVGLVVDALERSDARGTIELTVRTEGRDAVVAATGGGELRLPAADVVA
jgi:two-component system, NtrC family, sensor kinase